MNNIITIVIVFIAGNLYSQGKKEFKKTVFSKEISFVQVDTTHGSQTTVIEYPKYLVVIELPMINMGGGKKTDLSENIPKAERFLSFLKNEYKNKPVKYVLSSHWHLHSLSGITPFFKDGATLVVAKSNWEYSVKNGLFGTVDASIYGKQILQISEDTTILNDTKFPISVLFLDETYANKPTKDYLFFYMPKNKCIHASCMCLINEVDLSQNSEIVYSDRTIDLEKAIKNRNLKVEHLFKLYGEFDKDNKSYKTPVLTEPYYKEFRKRGKPTSEVLNDFANYELSNLQTNKNKVLNDLFLRKFSAENINSIVYICIEKKEYSKAVEWSHILNVYKIGKPDYINSMGEAYYNAGFFEIAQQISNQLVKLNPEFTNQFKVWEDKSKVN
jgi:hypothetical protein